MDELREALNTLREASASVPASDLADAMKEHGGAAYQAVFNRGFGVATEEKKGEVKRLTDRVETLSTEVQQKDGRVTELENNTGHEEELERLRGQLQETKDRLEATEETHRTSLRDIKVGDQATRLRKILVDENGVDADKADLLVHNNRGRIQPRDGDTGTQIIVMQDGLDIPMQAEDPVKALASELTGKLEPKWITSGADSGSGTGGSGAGGEGGGASGVVSEAKENFRKRRESRPNPLNPPKRENATA